LTAKVGQLIMMTPPRTKWEKIAFQMAATTMTMATTFMVGWWQPWSTIQRAPDSDSDFSGQER